MAVSGAYTYTLSGSNATITDYDASIGGYTPSIPSTLDGYTVTTIGANSFKNKSLTGVTFPSSVTSIGDSSFQGNSISTITIPSTLTSIGNYAFMYNGNITVNLNATVTSSSASPFYGCTIANRLTIGSGVTSIPSYLFEGAGITSVTFPSSVTSLGTNAFRSNSISTITIPSTLTSLGSSAFASNGNITLNLNATVTSEDTAPFLFCNIADRLTIGSGVTRIANQLFTYCSLTKVIIPSSVTSIGSSAFAQNGGLANFYVYNHSITFGSNVMQGNMSSGSKGTIYGNDPSNEKTWWNSYYTGTYNFSTALNSSPTVTSTSPATNLTTSSADVAGNVTSDGGETITERGFCYGTSANPTTSNSKKVVSGTTGSYSDTITGLNESTTYHFRAYAINIVGTSYGADVQFTTASSITTPTVTTTSPVTNTTSTSTNVAGNVTSDGNATVTERGFVYSTSANPTTANTKSIVSGTTGAMSASITGLAPNTTYHVRAYATNSQGTAYGADVSWTTVIRQGVLLEILEYQSTELAEASTSQSQIIITGHGLNPGDMIVDTTCRTTDAERGSRLVGATGWDADTLPLDDYITNAAENDSVRLYKFIDRTDLVRINTFRMVRRTGGKTEATFVLKNTSSYIPRAGQYVRINWNVGSTSSRMFLGVIREIQTQLAGEAVDTLFLTCQCVGLNQIPSRRTIKVYYEANGSRTYGDIVQDMVDNYLFQDGIRASTIDAGQILQDDWVADVISIAEVLDECASKSAYQWFVSDDGLLTFYQDPVSITDSAEDITDAGTFTDYVNLRFSESIDNYINKVFISGGRDTLYDNDIIIGSEDFDESTAMQEICAGTGVYGNVVRDAGIVESNWVSAEAGTTTTNIKITDHLQSKGYIIYNSTRNEYRQITAIVDDDNFTVDAVTSQTDGDDIVLYDQANKIIANEFKLRGFVPKKFSFETREMGFEPGTKMNVDLAVFGVSNEYYIIDDVEVYDAGGSVDSFRCKINCSIRDDSNFSTQRLPNFYNYFGGF